MWYNQIVVIILEKANLFRLEQSVRWHHEDISTDGSATIRLLDDYNTPRGAIFV